MLPRSTAVLLALALPPACTAPSESSSEGDRSPCDDKGARRKACAATTARVHSAHMTRTESASGWWG